MHLYVSAELEKRVDDLVKRRLEGEPVAYIIGEWEFYGLPLNISQDVLIPRADTEVLAERGIQKAREAGEGARVLDLGCGPGFPSIPLAIARPDLTICALDSTDKKIRFLNESAEMLGLSNLKGYSGRAEDVKMRNTLKQFDVVVSRAVARMNVLSELCMPYVKIGGKLIAMKGAKGDEELAEAQKAIKILGGTAKMLAFDLITEDSLEARSLIEVSKVKETPSMYPRQYSAIVKKPL
jgi:16S rRNA (guanine527-N7)-methyltransferase